MTTYEQLRQRVDPLLKHYRDDLLVHDKAAIEGHDGVPFLHWTHDTGTTIVFLMPKESYPAAGVYVPYLFGQADREHMLREVVTMAKFHVKSDSYRYTCHYFTGKTMRVVSIEEAVKIAEQYVRPILNGWHNEWLRDHRPHEYRAMREAGAV